MLINTDDFSGRVETILCAIVARAVAIDAADEGQITVAWDGNAPLTVDVTSRRRCIVGEPRPARLARIAFADDGRPA